MGIVYIDIAVRDARRCSLIRGVDDARILVKKRIKLFGQSAKTIVGFTPGTISVRYVYVCVVGVRDCIMKSAQPIRTGMLFVAEAPHRASIILALV